MMYFRREDDWLHLLILLTGMTIGFFTGIGVGLFMAFKEF
jgi:hypothetical protein